MPHFRAHGFLLLCKPRQARPMDLDAVASMLRGDPGSRVRLDVRRDGKPLILPVTRAQFKV